jgi:hybrid polyketide synthase/nonribosomal peptide synthetase ACE1
LLFDVVVEVGPHPALQGPASQTLQDTLEKTLPYYGTLSRSLDAVRSLSSVLAFLWSHLGKFVQLAKCQKALSPIKSDCKLLKGLPSY